MGTVSGEETPFSFHCMICFEEFHPEDRYPVVLPCGHTYVCNCCANRLDRCMECRTPLYELVPHPKSQGSSATVNAASWSSARPVHARGRSTDAPPPQPPMKRRLALPKNVVLLSLIEATELASADARQKYTESPRKSSDSTEEATIITGPSIPELQSKGSIVDLDDEEEEKIKISTSLAVGVAGTYAVAAKEGLEIFPSRPSSKGHVDAALHEEDVETLVRVYHLDQANSSREEEGSFEVMLWGPRSGCVRRWGLGEACARVRLCSSREKSTGQRYIFKETGSYSLAFQFLTHF
jgi:Zinc finger, C3HC4 type (RING finger)